MKNTIIGVLLLVSVGLFATDKPVDWKEPVAIRTILNEEGAKAGLPIGLAHCVAYTESRFNSKAKSRIVNNYRSCGLMQLYRMYIVDMVNKYSSHPKTFKWDNPRDNSEVGCKYLAYLIKRFGGSIYLGVLAYNYGETNVQNLKSIEEIPEDCMQYVESIMVLLDNYEETW